LNEKQKLPKLLKVKLAKETKQKRKNATFSLSFGVLREKLHLYGFKKFCFVVVNYQRSKSKRNVQKRELYKKKVFIKRKAAKIEFVCLCLEANLHFSRYRTARIDQTLYQRCPVLN